MKSATRLSNLNYRWTTALLLASATLSLPAKAIIVDSDHYVAVIGASASDCVQGASARPPAVICADANAASFSGSIQFTDPKGTGATQNWAVMVGPTEGRMDLLFRPSIPFPGLTHGGQAAANGVVGYSFSDYLLSGPAGMVNVTFTMTLSGTAIRNPSNTSYVAANTLFSAGTRNPAASSDPGRLDALTRLGLLFGPKLTSSGNFDVLAVNNSVTTGTYSVMAGTPFEFGYELRASLGNADIHMNTSLTLSAPAGYTLAMITPVPEPETWALLLAGLGLLGAVARRNQKKIGR